MAGLFLDVPGALGLAAGWWRRATFSLSVVAPAGDHTSDGTVTSTASATFDVAQRDFGWRAMLSEAQMASGAFYDAATDSIRVSVSVRATLLLGSACL